MKKKKDWVVGSPWSPRDSQESSPTTQFKASILWCSAFFMVQLSHPYMITGKTRALTRQTFVGKVMSLLFNMLSRLVVTFLPRSKCLLISWLQSPSAVTWSHLGSPIKYLQGVVLILLKPSQLQLNSHSSVCTIFSVWFSSVLIWNIRTNLWK